MGFADNSTTISHSYSTGNIIGNHQNTGGLVGLLHESSISNSYSIASVSGNDSTGGLAGTTTVESSISTSYSTGPVSASSGARFIGGLVGNGGFSSTVTDSYWNIETSGYVITDGGTCLITLQLKQQNSFSGFDFSSPWSIDEDNSYPYLQNNTQAPLPGIGDESTEPTVVYNQSLSFNGTDNYVEISDYSSLDLTNGFTIEAWVKPGVLDSDIQRVAAKKDAYGFGFSDTSLRFTTYGIEDYDLSYSIDVDQWVHLACVLDDDNDAHFYVNGTLVGSLNGPSPANTSTDPLILGSAPGTGYLNGQLDEVRLWSDVRTPVELRRNMFQALNGDEEGLAGYWPLNEGESTITFDLSANNRHGVLTNGPAWSSESHPFGTVITGSEGWRMMSSPIDGASYETLLDELWTQGFTGSDINSGTANVQTWDEANGWMELSDGATTPAAGTGFITYVYADEDPDAPGIQEDFPKMITIDNTQTKGAVSPTLSYTNTGSLSGDGWNLVGNPFGTTINWNAPSGWTRTNLDASFYVWNAADGEYQSHNGASGTLPDSLIGPWQGFWVKANAPNPELTDTVRSAGGMLLKETLIPQIKFELVKSPLGRGGSGEAGSGVGQTGLQSGAVVMFHKQAEPGKDPLDARKLESLNQQYLSLYTTDTERHALDINALAD